MAFPLSPINGQIATRFGRKFQFNSTSGTWLPVQAVAASTLAETSINTLSDIDLQTTAPQDGETLVWNAAQSKFVPGAASGSGTTVYATLAELPLSGNETGSQAFVSENNRLYLWNGSGWYNIALINTAPTIIQGGAASYSRGILSSDTVITLTATDPEGFPLTYSYSITGGSLQDTTVTQDGNVFTISPGATVATFTISFTASDGINISTRSSTFNIVNNPPVFTTSPESTYTLSPDGDPRVITLAATDPEGLPLTYGYSITSGSLQGTTITQDNNVFTITPSSTPTEFTAAFTASDGYNTITSSTTVTVAQIPQLLDFSVGTNSSTQYTATNGLVATVGSSYNTTSYKVQHMFTGLGGIDAHGTYWLAGGDSVGPTLNLSAISPNITLTSMRIYPRTRSDTFTTINSVQRSSNGSSWITIPNSFSGTVNSNYPATSFLEIDLSGISDKYFKINLSYTGSWGVSLNEIQFYGTVS